MEEELRRSGIDVIGSVPWGTHFCQFYQTKQDLIDILIPYFKAGLENNEFCMWVTSEPLEVTEAQEAMREAVKDFDEYLHQGQIEVIPYDEWYLLGGTFDDDRVLEGWVAKLEQALAKGYSGLRLTGNTFWLEQKHWHAFTEYEAWVNEVIGEYRMLALCAYCLEKCDATAVIDVVRNHQFGLVKQEGRWGIIESDIYKQTKQALLESQQDLNRAQAVAQTGSWRLDVRQNQLLWSDETHRIFGIPKGMPMTYETFLSSVHLEDREYVDQKWTAALRGEPYDIEHRIIVGDEVKWIRERAELEFDSRGLLKGGFGTAQDITERKQAEERIREQAQILEQVHDVVICTDLEGYILSWNIGAERVYGYSAEEVLGKHISSMYKDEQSKNPFYQQVIKPLLEKGSHDVEVEVPTKTGEERFVHLSFSGIRDSSGNVAMICGYGIDITERKKLEQLKDEFIGLVSHELGSPLTVITGCLNTVLDQATNLSEQEASHLLRNAAKEADALTHLLGNLLELARVQAERLFLHVEPVETDIVARNVIEKMTEQYPTYELLLDFPEELPPVDADPLRVERILYNLLDNACKYSPKGSKVRVFAKPDKDSVIIGISDQGVGIATSDREKIFQAFERIDSSVSGRGKGTGIGLLVCQRLVEAHGGRIWVKSASGKGSTFFFNLPCKRKG